MIDSPNTARLPYFLAAPIAGILGVLIAARRPRNPIGWLLLSSSVADAIHLLAGFIAIRGLQIGASPRTWVAWAAWAFNNSLVIGAFLIFVLIFFFPNGRLLPGSRWLWATRAAIAAMVLVAASQVIAAAPVQLSPRLPGVPNPLAVPALDSFLNGNSLLGTLSFLLLLGILVATSVVRFRRSRGVERSQMRWFAYVAGAALAVLVSSTTVITVSPIAPDRIRATAVSHNLHLALTP